MATAATKEGETGQAARSNGSHVVLVDALVVKTGDKVEEAVRYRRGNTFTPNEKYTDVERLVALKAIAPNDGEPKLATTARAAAAAAGGEQDGAANVPVHEVLPVQPESFAAAGSTDEG